MKIKAFPSILALFLLGFAASQLATAQSASGTYQFSLDDGYTKYVEFDAKKQADGSTTGQMTLTDEAKITVQDVDGTGVPEDTYPGFFIKADLDGLLVDKNQAVMCGTIRDSSVREFIGLRVLLSVEDNGDNTRVPDKLTWGSYLPTEGGWPTSDAELKDDPGVGMRWFASDAEVKDDQEVPMPKIYAINTQSFPVSTYDFIEVVKGAGDIIVRA
ncbi:MAG: hypothetical protein QOH25_1614 [Acidobacteriota bacterium]|jgi:hypothetical protein|nr:hypothetical protein [Acidobacteriota bacterium]